MLSDGMVELIHGPTNEQKADLLTKTLLGDVYWRHEKSLRISFYLSQISLLIFQIVSSNAVSNM